MLRLLKFLITGSFHNHEWKIHDEVDRMTEWDTGDRKHFRTTILKCKTCGMIKRKRYRI